MSSMMSFLGKKNSFTNIILILVVFLLISSSVFVYRVTFLQHRLRTDDTSQLKEAIITWANKQKDACSSKDLVEIADRFGEDISSLKNITNITRKKIPNYFFQDAEFTDHNPYFKSFINEIDAIKRYKMDYIATYGEMYKGSKNISDGVSKALNCSSELYMLVWAFIHPQSPYCNDPEVLIEIMKRFEFIEKSIVNGSVISDTEPLLFHNGFLFGYFNTAYYMMNTVFPDLLLPNFKERIEACIDSGMRYALDNSSKFSKQNSWPFGVVSNADTSYEIMGAAAGMILGNPEYLAFAQKGFSITKELMYKYGAFPYMYSENDTMTYHHAIIKDMHLYFMITGDKSARDLIKKSIKYYQMSVEPGGVAEYSTAPYWKHYWTPVGMIVAPEIVAYYTGDGMNRSIAQEQMDLGCQYLPEGAELAIALQCFRPDIKLVPYKDNYIKYDYNVEGIRGRYGNFSFVADARNRRISDTLAVLPYHETNRGQTLGKTTHIGALVTDKPTRPWPLNAALYKVCTGSIYKKTDPSWLGEAFLSYNENDALLYSDDLAGLFTNYSLTGADYGQRVKPQTGLQGRQAWLLLKDRIVGYVSIEATDDVMTYAIEGIISMGYGRSGNLVPKNIKVQGTGMNQFTYGNLAVNIHEQNYGKIAIKQNTPVNRGESFLATDICMIDENAAADEKNQYTFYKGSRKYFVVEIYPVWNQPADRVVLNQKNGLYILTVLNGKEYTMVFNPSAEPVEVQVTNSKCFEVSNIPDNKISGKYYKHSTNINIKGNSFIITEKE
ncbi:MAG TPA: hypothetical protein DCY35_03450 [Prolixibacteraceae bacterium]|nr:hypothetical protein [Prolixibacteraceae bacterium]